MPSTPPSSVATNSALDDVTNGMKTKVANIMPLWALICVALGVVLVIFLLFTIIVCSQRDPKRTRYHLNESQKARLNPKSRKKTDDTADTENIAL